IMHADAADVRHQRPERGVGALLTPRQWLFFEVALVFTGAIDRRRNRCSPRNSNIGAAMKTDELAAMTMPNSIGTAKLSTADPPHSGMGSIARKAVAEV